MASDTIGHHFPRARNVVLAQSTARIHAGEILYNCEPRTVSSADSTSVNLVILYVSFSRNCIEPSRAKYTKCGSHKNWLCNTCIVTFVIIL